MTTATPNRNLTMYGVADIKEYIEQVKGTITYKFTGGNMVVAGLLLDAQELRLYNDPERARQTLNIAKAILFAIMDGELVGTVERK
jgi:hypothetical protein